MDRIKKIEKLIDRLVILESAKGFVLSISIRATKTLVSCDVDLAAQIYNLNKAEIHLHQALKRMKPYRINHHYSLA